MTAVQRSGGLIGVQRRMALLGRLRYGERATNKAGKSYPRALEKWRLTSASKDLLTAAAELYGGKVQEWKDAPDPGMYELKTTSAEIDVLLPPVYSTDDGTPTYPYMQAYELWDGPTMARRCDGETVTVPKGRGLESKACLCNPDERTCEVVTRVTVMLPRLPGIGVWRMDSRGWTVATQLPETLEFLSRAAANRTYVPAVLRLEQRSRRVRGTDGKVETNRFVVPVLDVTGITPGQLLASPQTVNVPQLVTRRAEAGEAVAIEHSDGRPAATWGEEAPIEEPGQGKAGSPFAGRPEPPEAVPAPARSSGDPWMAAVHAEAAEHGLDHSDLHDRAVEQFKVGSLTELTPSQRGALRRWVKEQPGQDERDVPPGQVLPAMTPAPVSPDVPFSDPLPVAGDLDAIYQLAQRHGLAPAGSTEDWGRLYVIARKLFPDADPDTLPDEGWAEVGAQIAAGLHDG